MTNTTDKYDIYAYDDVDDNDNDNEVNVVYNEPERFVYQLCTI